MKILVDTSVWSLVLRNKKPSNDEICNELSELIRDLRVAMIGPVRQEILSGISDEKLYFTLKQKLEYFDDVPLSTEHFELAAHLSNTCRKKGIQGSHTDFLLCSVAIINGYSIFTVDKDFNNFSKYINIHLHKHGKG